MSRLHRAVSGLLALALPATASLVLAAALATPRPAQAAPRYAAMVVDGHTGRVLYARHADSPRYPASLTKIMTLYMLFDQLKKGSCSLETRFHVSKHASRRPPTKLGLKPGQSIRVIDAIRALVTKSANDAAAVVAENIGGTEANFAAMMTAKARQLGMTRTRFRNASGLPDSKQVTTARDMITLSRRIMRDFPEYYGFFRTKTFSYRRRTYRNHNRLLFTYRGTDGIKTGYTRASGFNLTSSVRRRGKHLVAVVLGGKTSARRNAHMRKLLDRAFPKAVARLGPRMTPPLRKPGVQVAARSRAPVRRARVRVAAMPLPRRNPVRRHPPVRLTVASLQQLAPGRRRPPARPSRPAPDSNAGYHVQVGAYATADDAVARLREVGSKARDVLGGHEALTMPLRNPERSLYRARFAGFDERSARKACATLISRAIPCIIMRAN